TRFSRDWSSDVCSSDLNLTLVKEMNYENWGNLRVSNDGKKVSMFINDHIYIMDIDGSNLNQVTDSDGSEVFGEFSPDNKYLLVEIGRASCRERVAIYQV